MLNFCLLIPKRHILARHRVVWRITRENRFRCLGCRLFEEPGKKKPRKHFWCTISRIRGNETPGEIATKFCLSVDVYVIITSATFCDDRLRGLGLARGRISRFSIDLRRRPYNSLALPCECVISAANYPISIKFCTQIQISISSMYIWQKKSKFFKFKMADGRHIENRFLAISRRRIGWFMQISEWRWRITCRYRSLDQKGNFRKFKMADSRHFENCFRCFRHSCNELMLSSVFQ